VVVSRYHNRVDARRGRGAAVDVLDHGLSNDVGEHFSGETR
jgi:hypothetical protein